MPPIVPNCAGMAGTKNFRVAKTAAIEGIPKMIAVLIFTKPCLYFGRAPTRLLAPTINKEYAVASTGSTPNKYTRTGTVKILPPPPIKPSETPINTDAKYPIISMIL